MTKERIEEIVFAIVAYPDGYPRAIEAVLAKLPEFQEAKWIKCSERMPDGFCSVFFFAEIHGHGPSVRYGNWTGSEWEMLGFGCIKKERVSHWMPRYAPAPPVEEKSALVKELRKAQVCHATFTDEHLVIEKTIDIVKRHEKSAKKAE